MASATEIERERRHHSTKIRRQLTTLNTQIGRFNHVLYEKNLREIIDVQSVMSDSKLKSFFSVFCQCFSQTLCDISLCYENLNCFVGDAIDDDGHDNEGGDQWEQQRVERIKRVCLELYGIAHVLGPIAMEKTPTPTPMAPASSSRSSKGKRKRAERENVERVSVAEKIVHCMRFVQICKNAVLYETQKAYYEEMSGVVPDDMIPALGDEVRFKVETHRLNEMVVIVGRKLSIDSHMIDDIDRTSEEQVPRLAELRVRSVFEAIVRAQDLNALFGRKPQSAMDVATVLLHQVFGIENNEATDSNLH